MKTTHFIFCLCSLSFLSCVSQQKDTVGKDHGITKIEKDKIIISNPDLEYEVIIMDTGFERWFSTNRKPKGYYTLDYLESKNRKWVQEWNTRAMRPASGIDYTIDYNAQTHYGYEVNYMLYHYLLYFQQVSNLKLD